MLSSPSHAVIGATNLEEAIEFFRLFGFEETQRTTLPETAAAALYGLNAEAQEAVLRVPGSRHGWTRLVETPQSERAAAPLDNRAFAIDLFSSNLEESIEIASRGGFKAGSIATHQFGPVSIREMSIEGPDRLNLTLLEQEVGRRPSVLDSAPGRLHSELHAFVWSVQAMDDKLSFWQDRGELETLTDAVLDSPQIGAVLGVPEKTVKLRLAVLADAQSAPARLEMIEFLGEAAENQPNFPLCGGLHAPAFSVIDISATQNRLTEAEFGSVVDINTEVHPSARAVSGVAPGNLRFELWQEG
jgi:catechol 2,3-dioxygenase-like lactoylglutathione lyase family enzyme